MKISELPQEIKELALEYQKIELAAGFLKNTDSLKEAFDWGKTKEEGLFWHNWHSTKEFKSELTVKNKYQVNCKGIDIDVYDVLKAFNVQNPAIQHAIKKLLKGGERGVKTKSQDYTEAIESITRAIELENN
jgi:hypothetical protein